MKARTIMIIVVLLTAVQAFGYDVEDEWDYVTYIDRQWDEKTQTPNETFNLA